MPVLSGGWSVSLRVSAVFRLVAYGLLGGLAGAIFDRVRHIVHCAGQVAERGRDGARRGLLHRGAMASSCSSCNSASAAASSTICCRISGGYSSRAERSARKQLGTLAAGVIQSRQTLAEFVEQEWWPRYAIPNLATDTRRRYLEVWDVHLLRQLGGYQLREITPMVVEDLRDQMTRNQIGAPTQRKTLMLLQGILRRAVVRGLIPMNPAQLVDKPRQRPTQLPHPLSPMTVERIRAIMLRPRTRIVPAAGLGKRPRRAHETAVGTAEERERNALIVSMLAYAGPRPIEDRGCTWGDLHERTIHVFATKTGRARDVDLIAPLAEDLARWRKVRGRPREDELVIPRPTGGQWTREDWANWRRRIWRPAAIEAGVEGDLRPYRLRGSFVSLLLWEGHSLPYVAEQAGHSTATLARHYAGTMRELETEPRIPAAEAIQQARGAIRRTH